MTLLETCLSLETAYQNYQAKQSCNRLEFLMRMSSAYNKAGEVTPETLVKVQVLAQRISGLMVTASESEQESLAFAVKLLQQVYTTVSKLEPDALLQLLQSEFEMESFETLLENLEQLDRVSHLDTSSLETPYTVMEYNNAFMVTTYDADGVLQVFYPNSELTSFQTLVTSSSVFILNLKVLTDLSALLLDVSQNAADESVRKIFNRRFHLLHKAMDHASILDSLVIFKETKNMPTDLPVQITKPRSVTESISKASFEEPLTGARCTAWILG